MCAKKILVVDDDDITQKLLKEVLEREGFTVDLGSSGEEAISLAKTRFYPIVVSDIRMLDLVDGLDVLKYFRHHHPNTIVILMTAFGSMETAVQAIKEGAFDYLSKPFQMEDFKTIIRKALKAFNSKQSSNVNAPEELKNKIIIGSSPKMLETYKILARAAMSEAAVLIVGESGTGKELIARAIHDNSSRRNKKYIAVNCGVLTETLLESELFGHLKGSFTNAYETRKGLFEQADGGTLFLDEIGDISFQMQINLLRVLQDGEIRAVGGSETKKVNVRIIAATHHSLIALVSKGLFREDLYYRLKVINIELPPLRERVEDIPELVVHFLAKYAKKNNKPIPSLSKSALSKLTSYHWPGNVRELENTIERTVALSNSNNIDVEDLPCELNQNFAVKVHSPITPTSLEELEKNHILKVLEQVQYNKTRAAEILKIDRATLYRKAQKYGLVGGSAR